MRVDGKFVDADGNKVCDFLVSVTNADLSGRGSIRVFFDKAHLTNLQVLLYLLRRCYGLIYKLMAESEPISEELMPMVRLRLCGCNPLLISPIGKQTVYHQEMLK